MEWLVYYQNIYLTIKIYRTRENRQDQAVQEPFYKKIVILQQDAFFLFLLLFEPIVSSLAKDRLDAKHFVNVKNKEPGSCNHD